MSRLDWFTILIVGVCVIALGFLIYKTVQLVGNEKTKLPRTEAGALRAADDASDNYGNSGEAISDNSSTPGADDQDPDDDELTYDPQEVEAPEDKQEESKTSAATSTKKSGAETKDSKTVSKPAKSSTSSATVAKPSTSSRTSSSTGRFRVVAGSFSQRLNAENQVRRLKRLGYPNAQVEMINNGALASALVDRFDSSNEAKSLVSELKRKGVDAIVKRR